MHTARDTGRARAETIKDPTLVAMDKATGMFRFVLDRVTEIRTGAPASHGDADLIAACEDAMRCEGVIRAIDDGRLMANTPETHAANQNWDSAYDRVAELPAAGLVGIRAKAAALRLAVLREVQIASGDWVALEEDSVPMKEAERHERIALSLCDDVAALLGSLSGAGL